MNYTVSNKFLEDLATQIVETKSNNPGEDHLKLKMLGLLLNEANPEGQEDSNKFFRRNK